MDKLYQLSIGLLPGIGSITAKKLISYCGSVEAVFMEKKAALLKIPGIGQRIANAVSNKSVFNRAEQELKLIDKNRIKAYFYLDKEYPYRLKQCIDCPLMLFYKGNVDLNAEKVISIVGTRDATDYGIDKVKEIVKGLAKYNILIVSGLAYGIDVAAHKASISNNVPTVGVLGHGLDRIYPELHKKIASQMVKNGGLLTEFFFHTKPDRENFPMRNRIIAGLSDAVVVAEAAEKGGALITAHIANSYDRDVFALPGRSIDTYSKGCNRLIKTHKAHVMEGIEDIEYIMRWDIETTRKSGIQRQIFVETDEDENVILEYLAKNNNAEIDAIVSDCGFNPSKTASLLLNLEFKGLLRPLPGKIFKIIN